MPKRKPPKDDPEKALEAVDSFNRLIFGDLSIERIDQTHDLLRLMGIILAQMALLEVLNNPLSAATARVAAAKQLLSTGEDPASIAERLRTSPLSGLTYEQIQQILDRVKEGQVDDLQELIDQTKGRQEE